MSVLTDEYNDLLKRFYKATDYLDNKKIPMAERKRWLPEFQKIILRMNEILGELKKQGREPSNKEIMEGL
mgnify:CR=1 FL=1